MNQETLNPAPEEQFGGLQPEETDLNKIETKETAEAAAPEEAVAPEEKEALSEAEEVTEPEVAEEVMEPEVVEEMMEPEVVEEMTESEAEEAEVVAESEASEVVEEGAVDPEAAEADEVAAPEAEVSEVAEEVTEPEALEVTEEAEVVAAPEAELSEVAEEVTEPEASEVAEEVAEPEASEVAEEVAEPEASEVAEEVAEPEASEIAEAEAEEAAVPEAPKDISSFQHYSTLSLAEILLEFDRLLNLKDSTQLMRNAELLKSVFYKGLRKERGGEPLSDTPFPMLSGVDEGDAEEIDFMESIPEMAMDEAMEDLSGDVLLFVEEENAFKRMYAKYKSLRIDFLKQQELHKEHNLQLKQAIIDELKRLVEKQEDLNHTFPEFRALQTRWKEVGPVPIANTKDIWDTYQHFVEKFYDYVKINNELRDLDFRKNFEQKTLLCEKSEELLLDTNILSAFHKLQKLHEEWRESGPVAREHREQVWERFRAATSEINRRHQTFFEAQKDLQKRNLEEKTALCVKIEEIAVMVLQEAHDWNKRSKEVENIQKAWRSIGFASKRENQKVYDRFRAACNKFYEGKRKFYMGFKHEMSENYKRKIALCEQAEALKESEEWRKTSDLLVNLQRQWKEIGPVTRKYSDQIWRRFRSACDAFFENKGKHFSSIDDSYEKNLMRKEALIEEIGRFEPSNNSNATLSSFKEFQRRWGEIGFVPMKDKERIHSAYIQVLDQKFSALRPAPEGGGRKVGKPKRRTEDVREHGKPERTFRSDREKLLFKFRQMESDIALWENNMGFFAKSKNADNMIAEMERKIVLAKDELLEIEEKIKMLDKQFD